MNKYKTFLEVPGLQFELLTDRPELHDILSAVFSAGVPRMGHRDRETATIRISATLPEQVASNVYARVSVDGQFMNDVQSEGALVNYIETVVTDKLARHFTNYLLFHSGAVAHEKTAVLLPGASRNGKSTSTTSLALSGFTYYSDEMAVCSVDGRLLFPFPKMPGLKTGGREVVQEHFRDAAEVVYHPEIDNVTYFRPPVLPPDADETDGIPIRFVLLPGRPVNGETVLEPVKKSEALSVLVQESLDLELRHTEGFEALASIVRDAECFAIKLGDVHKGIDLVRRLVE